MLPGRVDVGNEMEVVDWTSLGVGVETIGMLEDSAEDCAVAKVASLLSDPEILAVVDSGWVGVPARSGEADEAAPEESVEVCKETGKRAPGATTEMLSTVDELKPPLATELGSTGEGIEDVEVSGASELEAMED